MGGKFLLTVAVLAIAGGMVAALLLTFLLRHGGDNVPEALAEPAHGAMTVEELRSFEESPVFWLGEEFQGLPLTHIAYRSDPGRPGVRPPVKIVSMVYGDCEPDKGGVCVPPLAVFVDAPCLNPPGQLAQRARRGSPFTIRGAMAQHTESGNLHVYTGESTIVIFATEGDETVLAAANALRGANASGRAHAPDPFAPLAPPVADEVCRAAYPNVPTPGLRPLPTEAKVMKTPVPQAPEASETAYAGSQGQTSTVVRVSPASKTLITGNPLEVQIWVDDVQNLGGERVILELDSTIAHIVGGECVWLPDLLYLAMGTSQESLDIGCTKLGSEPGVDGSGALVTADIVTIGEGSTALALSESELYAKVIVEPGTPVPEIPHTTQDGLLEVIECPDQNGDNVINVTDLVIIGDHLLCQVSDECYDPLHDVNGDGVINVTDLALVGSVFLQTCP